MPLSLLTIQAAYILYRNVSNQLSLRLPKILDDNWLTLHWHLFSALGRQCLSTFLECKEGQNINKGQWHMKFKMLGLTVGYRSVTINRTNWYPDVVIGTNGSSQIWQNPWVDVYCLDLALPAATGRVFELVWNRTNTSLCCKPTPRAGLLDPLLMLHIAYFQYFNHSL